MDIDDFVFGFFPIIGGIMILALVLLGIYTTIVDINKNINDYQKCICQKVEE